MNPRRKFGNLFNRFRQSSSREGAEESSTNLSASRISQEKILKLNSSNLRTFNDKIKFILIDSKTIKGIEKLLKDFNPEIFPNAFVICMEVKNETQKIVDSLQMKLDEKFPKLRPIFAQINSKRFLRKKNEKFKEIELNLSEEEIEKSLKESKFSTEIFLNILKDVKPCDSDFEKFLKFNEQCEKESQETSDMQRKFKEENFYLGAIKAQDDFCLRLLNLYEKNFCQETQNQLLSDVIETKSFEVFLAFFDAFDEAQIKIEEVGKFFEFQNYFLQSFNAKNVEVAKYFLKLNLNYSIMEEVLNVGEEFYKTFNVLRNIQLNQLPSESLKFIQTGQKMLEDVQKFHEDIKSGNLEEIKKFSIDYPNLKICYGLGDVSAMDIAIDNRQFKIYSYLRAKSFTTKDHKLLQDKINALEAADQREIRDHDLKYAQEFPDAFIGILLSKCKFDALSPVSEDVKDMLIELSANENLKPFLQIAAQADVTIIFDFATESVKSMVPGCDEHTMGIAFFGEGKLYVGNDRDRPSRTATFMHELTHMVLNLIYENNCLPYCKDDAVRESEWKIILEDTQELYERGTIEEIIQWVFQCYSEGWEQLAELAVRPNHIMARYSEDPQKLAELRLTHGNIFDFIEQKVLTDLRIPNVYRLIKLNNDFEVIKGIESYDFKLNSIPELEILRDNRRKIILTSNVPKLALLKLLSDIRNSSENKLDAKVKNIFIDVDKFDKKTLSRDLFNLIESSQIDCIIFELTKNETKKFDNIKTIIKNFSKPLQIIIVCGNNNFDSSDFETVHKNFSFQNLTTKSQKQINKRKIKFQGKEFTASEVFESISDEAFALLCNGKEISINPIKEKKTLENFIPRTIKKSEQRFDLEAFLSSVEKDQIILISDLAGNGKSSLLDKIHEKLLRKLSSHWISFVSLIEHVDELLIDDVEDDEEDSKRKGKISNVENKNAEDHPKKKSLSFQEKLIKILKLKGIEEEIFTKKFSKGKVKILFDGFDEISPKCKKQTLKLFKNFKKQNKNQIFITTRTHLEQDLKQLLKVESFEIEPLNQSEQIKFLCDFWKNSHDDKSLIEKCAEELTQKISEIVKDQNLIGIPLIVQGLAKLYKNEINEEFSKKIQTLKFSEIFQKIIEHSLDIFADKFPSNLRENSLKRMNIFQALEHLAIVNYFGENFPKLLGLPVVDFHLTWPFEEIAREGILSYDENKKVKFNHETYGQRFLSTVMENILESSYSLSDPQIELLTRILTDERFEIARMFLRENFEQVKINKKLFKQEKILNFNPKNLIEGLCKNLRKEVLEKVLLHKNENGETILHLSVEFGNFEIVQTVLDVVSKSLKNNERKEFIRAKNEKKENALMLATFKPENSLKLLFEFVFDLMERSEIFELLTEKDEVGNNVLHLAAGFAKSKEIFEFLWLKIFENFKGEEEKLKNYLKVKGEGGRNILMRSIEESNEISFYFIFENIFEKFFNFKDFIYECEDEGENLLHFLARFGSVSMLEFVFKKLQEKLSEKEFKSFLLIKSEKYQNNLLHCGALQNQNLESIKFLWKAFEENLSEEEIFEFLNEKDEDGDNVLHLTAGSSESKEIFEFWWLKIFENFKSEEDKLKNYLKVKGWSERNILMTSIAHKNENSFYFIFENIFEKFFDFKDFIYECEDEMGENFLHKLARFGSVSMLEFAFKKLQKKLSEVEFKSFLMIKSEKYQNNLLHCAAAQNQNLDSIKLLWKVLEENLSQEEFFELLTEKDEDGNNVLHYAAAFAELKEIFEFLWLKIFENFKGEEEKLKNYLKVKGGGGRNILMESIGQRNENTFHFIFENIFEKFFDFKDFIYECDDFGENFLHQLARFGSVSMLEFAFKKLQEKLSKDEFKSFLLMKSEKNQLNLLHCAALQNENLDSIKFLIEEIEKTLRRDGLKEMLNERDTKERSPLHCAIAKNISIVFNFFTNIYEENFPKNEIKRLLETMDFIQLANDNEKDKNMTKCVEKFYQNLD